MDDFLNNNTPEEENFPKEEFNPYNHNEPQKNEPVYNSVKFTPVEQVKDYKPMSKGLKVFSLILALTVALTGTTLTGYYIGKNGGSTSSVNKEIKIELEAQPTDKNEKTAAAVYKMVDASVVGITIYNDKKAMGEASGIVYSEDGYIVTNDHIYSEIPNAKFKIHTYDGKEYDAKYVAGDLVSDLAVLKIDSVELIPASFANSDDLYMGQKVVAIGRPNDATDISSITSGIISATNRRVSNSSNYPARLIQTDCAINPGSSGGALVNMYGQIVGVTSSKISGVSYEGVSYAIPTTVMKRIVSELISKGRVESRAKLGITYYAVNSVIAEIENISTVGLQIQSVATDSDLVGKVSKGDIIVKINDTAVSSDDMVLDIIENCTAGDSITVTVLTTKGETKNFTVTLSANIGESSYNKDTTGSGNGGTFNFPNGE